jgi:hypothetical protein
MMLTPIFVQRQPPYTVSNKGVTLGRSFRMQIHDSVNGKTKNAEWLYSELSEVIRVKRRVFLRWNTLFEWDQRHNVLIRLSSLTSSFVIYENRVEAESAFIDDHEGIIFRENYGFYIQGKCSLTFHFSIPRPQPTQIFVYQGGGRFYTENEDRVVYYYDVYEYAIRTIFKFKLPREVKSHILSFIKC